MPSDINVRVKRRVSNSCNLMLDKDQHPSNVNSIKCAWGCQKCLLTEDNNASAGKEALG